MQDLVIFGDSWAVGIWSDQNGILENPIPYLSECFKKHYGNVTNHSHGGKSNRWSLRKMVNHLQTSASEDMQLPSYLFIQTDPYRDIFEDGGGRNRLAHIPKSQIPNSIKMLNKMIRYNLCITYIELENLCQEYNIQINITGGCSDIDDLIHDYAPSLNIVCDSFYKLIDKDHKNHPHSCTTSIYNSFGYDLHIPSEDQIYFENMSELVKASEDKLRIQDSHSTKPNEPNYFGYAPDNHPGHKGLDMWVEHMLPRMK